MSRVGDSKGFKDSALHSNFAVEWCVFVIGEVISR